MSQAQNERARGSWLPWLIGTVIGGGVLLFLPLLVVFLEFLFFGTTHFESFLDWLGIHDFLGPIYIPIYRPILRYLRIVP